MKHKIVGLVVFLVLGCALMAAGANNEYLSLGKGSDQPIDITSTKFTARNIPNGKEATFEGNVKVNQGDVTLSCDQLVLVYDEKTGAGTGEGRAKKLAKKLENVSQIKSITASGNVKIVQNERMAVAGKALYDNAKRTITLTEGPRLWQGADVMVANTIIIYLDENRVDSLGGDSPITFKINPEQQKKEKEK
ncbi:MAG: LptA/OstA family protein [Desulfomonilaceae bacterium]